MRRKLLKFCSPSEHAIKNLEHSTLFCQHYSAYNDPFEFRTRILEGIPDPKRESDRFLAALAAWGYEFQSIEEVVKDSDFIHEALGYFDECKDYYPPFSEMRDSMRIACFGSQADNLLMWSHYADGLRGFCIVFDEDLIANAEPEGYVENVAYMKTPPAVDTLVYGISYDQEWFHEMAMKEEGRNASYQEAAAKAMNRMREIWRLIFAAKPMEWRYEQERRLLVPTQRSDTLPILRAYPREAVREIILGERMPTNFRTRFISILANEYPHVQIKNACRSESRYELVID